MRKFNNKKSFLVFGACVFLLGITGFAITSSNLFRSNGIGSEGSSLSNNDLFHSYCDYAAN